MRYDRSILRRPLFPLASLSMRTIEWPKGSGRTADYADDEMAQVTAMIATAKELGIPSSVVADDISTLHIFKVELDARIREYPPLPDWIPPADSPFRLPAALVAELRQDEPLFS